jgi:inward rectifier potassium channel
LSTLPPNNLATEKERDLGFGSSLSRRSNFRLLNRDGSFNVKRHRSSHWSGLYSYNALVFMPAWRFFVVVLIWYMIINSLFAGAYLLCGPGALHGDAGVPEFMRAFFFSVHTFATIGYGNITPVGVGANLLVTMESLVGLTSFALLAGLVFARFSRPTAKIIYSRQAIIAPYGGGTAFEFRIMNGRDNELVEVHATITMGRFESLGGIRQRKFYPLDLERRKVSFFPLNWTIVHPIDERSPLWGWNETMMRESETEFLILLTAIDDTFAQTVHNRGSYTAEEVVWGAKFLPLVDESADGMPMARLERFHEFEKAELMELPKLP